MAWQIKTTNTSQRGSGKNHFGGHGGGWFNSGGQGGHGRGCGHSPSTNSNTQPKPNASGFYLDWNKLSFEECDKIHKEHKEKLDQSGTNKRNLGDISMDMLPPSPGWCNRLNLPMTILLMTLMTLHPGTPMPAMHSEARPMPRRTGQGNDWQQAPVIYWVPSNHLTTILPLILVCLLFLCHHYMLNLSTLVVNLTLMLILVLLVWISSSYLTLVVSATFHLTMQIMAIVRKMCQLSAELHLIPVSLLVKCTSWSSMRGYGLAPSCHTLS